MGLVLRAWGARLMGSEGLVHLPFDLNFKQNDSMFDNNIQLRAIGRRPSWYIFVDFAPMDPSDPSYPHFVEVDDDGDYALFELPNKWSERAGIQNGYGPVPTSAGRRRVRLTMMNANQQRLASQTGDYFIHP